MLLIFGRRTAKIKSYRDQSIKCEKCGQFDVKFLVYLEYFHIFFIPLFPSGIKEIEGKCNNCGRRNFNQKKEDYLSLTRTPFYVYTAPLLIAVLIGAGIYFNLKTQKQKAEWIDHPIKGDVYLIRDQTENKKVFYWYKVSEVQDDSVKLFPNTLEYSMFVSVMDSSDYFITNKVITISRTYLKQLLTDHTINSVSRDYSEDSQFNIQREFPMGSE